MLRIYKYRYSDFIFQNKEVIDFYDSLNFTKLHKVKHMKYFAMKKKIFVKHMMRRISIFTMAIILH